MLGCRARAVNSVERPQNHGTSAKLIAAVGHSSTPPPTPPSCSDCSTKTQPAGGGTSSQSASRMWKSSDGKFRLDTPTSSVISDPGSQKTILLDHIKKEATIFPTPPAGAGTAPGIAPQGPAAAGSAPALKVEDLGKSMIEGHEVEGKRFTLPPFSPPQMAGMPKMPGTPQAPGASPSASAPKPPQMPTLPKVPSVTEVWTSVKLKTPVLTRVTTAAGEQTTYCKPVSMDEPHPSVFQIPPGYRTKPPKV
jgi:hypothetical protein